MQTADDETQLTGDLLEYLWQKMKGRRQAQAQQQRQHNQADTIQGNGDGQLSTMCRSPEFDWTQNSLGLNPCQVARCFLDLCQAQRLQDYPLYALTVPNNDTRVHYPDLAFDQADPCSCSDPVYNLIQVCAACQQAVPSGPTIPFLQFTANCSMPLVDFPYDYPVPLPVWAAVDTSLGSINISNAFDLHRLANNPFSPAPAPSTSTSATLTTSTASTSSTADTLQPSLLRKPRGLQMLGLIIGLVVVGAITIGVLAGIAAWLRRVRRTRRQGKRLGSTADLVVSSPPSEPKPDMQELKIGAAGGSTLIWTESFLSSRPTSRTDSYTTNSLSSSQSHDYRAFLGGGGGGTTSVGGSSFSETVSGTSGTASSLSLSSESSERGGETASRSSSSRSFGGGGRDSLSLSLHLSMDDDNANSPFGDVHRAPPTMREGGGARVSAAYPHNNARDSVVTFASVARSAVGSMGGVSTVSSRLAPSSTGAVWGRDADGDSVGSRRD